MSMSTNYYFFLVSVSLFILLVVSGCIANLSGDKNSNSNNVTLNPPNQGPITTPPKNDSQKDEEGDNKSLNLTDLSNYCFALGGKFTSTKYASGSEEFKCVFPNNYECKLSELLSKNCSYDLQKETLKGKAYSHCLNPDIGAVFLCDNQSDKYYRVVSRKPYEGSVIYFENSSRIVCPVVSQNKQSYECNVYLTRSVQCEELCKIFYSSNKSIFDVVEKYCVITGGTFLRNASDLSKASDLCILPNNVTCKATEYYNGNCPIPKVDNSSSKVKTYTITSGYYSRITERKFYLIPISQEMENVWREMFPDPAERPQMPEIDFSTYNVLAVYDGQRRCGGYSMVLENVEESEKEIRIKVKTLAPGKNCLCATVITYPYIIIGISKSDKNITLIRNLEVTDC
ncbi:MAG: protease complex subunit PrcB family protein [Candidatus Micrarchaeota archaeon]|nr:protease complex subunit PrcB family protein [Candidatus Micrarchaeota archaeon]